MFKAIFTILGPLVQGVGSWMAKYVDDKNTEARRINERQKKLDEYNKELEKGDLDTVRKRNSS
jgi:hypothetical protein